MATRQIGTAQRNDRLAMLLFKKMLVGLRSTVMMLLAVMDPEGSYKRKMRRLNRRIYSNKVGLAKYLFFFFFLLYITCIC